MTLTIELNTEQVRRLEEAAHRLNISVADLARAAINDLVTRQADEFERIIDRVLTKNAELYRRLA